MSWKRLDKRETIGSEKQGIDHSNPPDRSAETLCDPPIKSTAVRASAIPWAHCPLQNRLDKHHLRRSKVKQEPSETPSRKLVSDIIVREHDPGRRDGRSVMHAHLAQPAVKDAPNAHSHPASSRPSKSGLPLIYQRPCHPRKRSKRSTKPSEMRVNPNMCLVADHNILLLPR
ncbi:hypothetical protein L596_003130 [Steinernema carpocapsae]|uniref:Uncharacterized protein n=1 Tax=Steinernema carpocapsae TaxID=34508 RepID=A0A4U8UT60_STECR|nr:hypothetical protein L596_003130 [Steinernema carpocapsae]